MDKWSDIALPALEAVRDLQAESSHGRVGSGADIAKKLEKPISEVEPQLQALRDDEYIIAKQESPSDGSPVGLYSIRLAPRGLRYLGEWPPTDIERLVDVVSRISDHLEGLRNTLDMQRYSNYS